MISIIRSFSDSLTRKQSKPCKLFGNIIMRFWLVLSLCTLSCGTGMGFTLDARAFQELPFKNGSTFIFTSFIDQSVITVHKSGDVTTETFRNIPEQLWTVVTHPYEPNALEFKQAIVPYNMLSGFEESKDNPGMFPRPLGLSTREIIDKIPAWNILIRGRWCLQANGNGYPMDMDDCESFTAPWQLWQIQEV